jgi:DNA-binding LytR/AlgR family response regulator
LEELKSGPRHLERLVIKNGGRVFFLNVQDVYCIESEGNYVRVYDNQKGYLLRETISSSKSSSTRSSSGAFIVQRS